MHRQDLTHLGIKIMSDHSEIARKFATRQPNKKRKGRVVWSGSRVYCIDDIIFSYGSHFPMAKHLGEKGKKRLFIKNADKYSSSTSAHQSLVRQHCPGPEVSRSKLSKYVHFEDLTMKHIHLWRPGIYKHMWQDTQTGAFYDDAKYRTLEPGEADPTEPFMSLDHEPDANVLEKAFKVVNLQRRVYVFVEPCKLSRQGKFKPYRKQESKRFQQGIYSVQEVLVLKINDKYLLSTNDTLVELEGEPKTIVQALKMKKAA